jgi:formate hydrogenlyase subunit 3/multisubunit Na+/H+ antiporter MnhD subunit
MDNYNENGLKKTDDKTMEDCGCKKGWFGLDSFCINGIVGYVLAVALFAAFLFYVAVSSKEGKGIFIGPFVGLGEGISDFLFTFKSLPVWIIMIPLIGGPLEAFIGKRSENGRDMAVVNTTFITLFLILSLYPQVVEGTMRYAIPRVLGIGMNFKVDMLGFIMLLTSAVLWLMVSIYAHDYMGPEKHRNRFFFWMSITYGGILGTIMAGDLLTMFLFFEVMTFASYFLVAHNQSKESLSAGANYIYMGVVGGLCLLLGIILVYVYTGTLAFVPMAGVLSGLGWIRYLIAAMFIIGFGIKAGMLPLHIWLPKAHPVAPTPASALLSGLMIKIGAFGILRVMTSFFMPAPGSFKDYKDPLWLMEKNLGAVIIWIGIITMAVGVFMALQQSHMKKMLAYHSISQMGYIIMGIGVAAYLGPKGAMGFAGAVYHMVNHALFKALLFMVAGVIYLKTHEMDMYKLGGLWRKFPFTAAMCLIAILGITGMPLFNGFASKSILHHAIIEAYEYGSPVFKYAEIMFTIISAGTVCSFIKLFGFVFLGKLPERFEHIKGEKLMMNFGMGGLAVLIILIGEFPNFMLEKFIIPAVSIFSYDPAFIEKYLGHMNFFNQTDMIGMVYIYFFGAIIFYVGIRYHLFHLHLPRWLDGDFSMNRGIRKRAVTMSSGLVRTIENTIVKSDVVLYALVLTGIILYLLLR